MTEGFYMKKFTPLILLTLISCVEPPIKSDLSHNKEWMQNLKDSAKLTEIVLPGSHDAGSYGMVALSETQGSYIIDQLNAGVRYFDIRVAKIENSDELLIFHSPSYGMPYTTVLQDIKEFIEANSSEFLILHFQHFQGGSEAQTAKLLNDALSPEQYAIPSDINAVTLSTLTYGETQANSYRYIIAWGGNMTTGTEDYYYRSSDILLNPYEPSINSLSGSLLMKGIISYYDKQTPSKFFVLQTIGRSAYPLGHENLNASYYNNFTKSLADESQSELLQKTNVIMRDFVTSPTCDLDAIIKLNEAKELFQ